jgi:hypothetical protein
MLFCIHEDWRQNTTKTSIVSFFHRQSTMQQQDTINEKGKMIRTEYILNKKAEVWGFHWITIEEPGLPGCCSVWLRNLFTKFRRNVPPSSSGLSKFLILKIMVVRSFESREEITQTHGVINQKTWFFNTKTGLQIVKFFSAVLFPVGIAATLALH